MHACVRVCVCMDACGGSSPRGVGGEGTVGLEFLPVPHVGNLK